MKFECMTIRVDYRNYTLYSLSGNADVVNIKNLRIKYNNNNNLHGLM